MIISVCLSNTQTSVRRNWVCLTCFSVISKSKPIQTSEQPLITLGNFYGAVCSLVRPFFHFFFYNLLSFFLFYMALSLFIPTLFSSLTCLLQYIFRINLVNFSLSQALILSYLQLETNLSFQFNF